MKLFPIIFSIFIATSCHAQQSQTLNIIPAPVKAEVKEGKFTITSSTKLALAASNVDKSAAFLNAYLKKLYGFELKITKGNVYPENAIILNFDRLDNSIPGAYEMTVDKDKIYIGGNDEQGVFYGLQTLIQLLPVEISESLAVQQCSIVDSPRFSYRGLHLDVGRHFFPVDFIKEYIDYIALHKMNYFHWHLTEDQGQVKPDNGYTVRLRKYLLTFLSLVYYKGFYMVFRLTAKRNIC